MQTYTPHFKNKSLKNIIDKVYDDYVIEEWRTIKEFDGLYQVSNFGRVKGVKRVVGARGGKTKVVSEKIIGIKPDKQGYFLAALWKNNNGYSRLVHRLVAQAFIPNPNNLPEVNHNKGLKWDNTSTELGWMTASDNQRHSIDVLGKKTRIITGADNKCSKKVLCLNSGIVYNSTKEAAIGLGVSQPFIVMLCKKQRTSNTISIKYKG